MAAGLLESEFLGLQTIEHVMRVSRTWDSIVSLLPKGGETVWGNLDWSPEEGYNCESEEKRQLQALSKENNTRSSTDKSLFQVKHHKKYGRIISFGKEASEVVSSQLPTFSKVHTLTCVSYTHNLSNHTDNASMILEQTIRILYTGIRKTNLYTYLVQAW